MTKEEVYEDVENRINLLVDGERDQIAIMSTIACELFQAFDSFHWVGFYRHIGNETLKVGPYLGGHGCLTILFSRGVCGKCATTKETQIIADINDIPFHIACAATTRSEIVVPVLSSRQEVIAVLDVDSDDPNNFDGLDQKFLERIVSVLH